MPVIILTKLFKVYQSFYEKQKTKTTTTINTKIKFVLKKDEWKNKLF